MPLTLRIENHDSLPDGGPLSVMVTEDGIEVGRDSAMGWTLPDPNRFISSRHFEIRHERGAFWLYDTSTNGTFLNGAASRVKSPHRLAGGDRLQVGPYRIVVEEAAAAPFVAPRAADPFAAAAPRTPPGGGAFGGGGSGGDIWGVGAAPAPIPDFDPRPARRLPDFGDQHLEMPRMAPEAAPAASPFGGAAPAAASPFGGAAPAAASPFGGAAPAAASPFGDAPAAVASPFADAGPSPFGSASPAALQPPQAPAAHPPEASPFGQAAAASPFAPAGMPGAASPPPPIPGQMPGLSPADEGFRPPPPVAAPPPQVAPAGPGGGDPRALVEAICAGAGLPPGSLSATDPTALGHEVGRMLRLLTEELSALLRARAATKQSVRAGQRTMIGATDNNPLKFMPGPEEALDAMLGRPRPGFLRGAAAVQEGFADVKQHQYATHAALQPALARLLEDLSPEAIEAKASGGLMSSRKARAWDVFVERWDAKTHPYENGMLDVFLTYYAEAYDQATKKRSG